MESVLFNFFFSGPIYLQAIILHQLGSYHRDDSMWCNCNESKILNNSAWAASKGAYGGGRGTWSLYVWRAWVHMFRSFFGDLTATRLRKRLPWISTSWLWWLSWIWWLTQRRFLPPSDVCSVYHSEAIIHHLHLTTMQLLRANKFLFTAWFWCSFNYLDKQNTNGHLFQKNMGSLDKTEPFNQTTWTQNDLEKHSWNIGIPCFHWGLWISTSAGIWIWWLSANANPSKAADNAKWRPVGDFQKGVIDMYANIYTYVYMHPRICIIIS